MSLCYANCADQVVFYNGKIREKPETATQCKEYLGSYVAAPATTYTSVVVVHTASGREAHATDVASQAFLPVPDDVVDIVIAKGDIMECCGGFMVDEPLLAPFLGERVGTEESIIGLPVHLLPALIDAVTHS